MKGENDIRLGIMAVTERIRTGRLKIARPGCPNLVAESQLYRYPTAEERAIHGENPVDEHNHALGALRYLVAKLDRRRLGRRKGVKAGQAEAGPETAETQHSLYGTKPTEKPWNRLDNEQLWENLQ
jgi:hypothetical protein